MSEQESQAESEQRSNTQAEFYKGLQGVIFAIFCLALPMAELFGLSALLASQEDQDNWYTLAGFLGGCLVIGATGVGMFFVARRVFKRWFS
jgi:hypothetical protein